VGPAECEAATIPQFFPCASQTPQKIADWSSLKFLHALHADEEKEGVEMKLIVMVFGLLVSTAAFGNGLAQMDKTERCTVWVTNAMLGATQYVRGASREVQYVSRSTLVEMLMHHGGVAPDKIYLMADDGYTEEEREFLEESTLFGYDAMSSRRSRNVGPAPRQAEWQRNLMAMCLEHNAI
jgi:hypothetical protein